MTDFEKPSAGETAVGWFILIIPLLLVFLLFVLPFFSTTVLSFQNWNALDEPQPAGLDNYARLLADRCFHDALRETFFSPLLYLRVILLAAAPLALALLLMELKSGFRVSLHALAGLLVFFSGAAGLALFHASSLGGDAQDLAGAVSGILAANGLAFSIPLGIVFYLAVMRGARFVNPDRKALYAVFWLYAWRVFLVFLVGVIGFSVAGLEGAYVGAGQNLINYQLRHLFTKSQTGEGAAAIFILLIPLVLLGAGLTLLLELSRPRPSLRFVKPVREALTVEVSRKAGRVTGLVLAATCTIIVGALLVHHVFIPFIGSFAGHAEGGIALTASSIAYFYEPMFRSWAAAFVSGFICLIVTAAAGFALGFLRPAGAKAVLVLFGAFLFISPAMRLQPFFLGFRSLGLLKSQLSLIIPGLISPMGVILYTWFFRGFRDEKTALAANGLSIKRAPFVGRIFSSLALFSLPMLALNILSSLNMILFPVFIATSPEPPFQVSQISLLFLRQTGTSPGLLARFGQMVMLQYLLPASLLLAGIIVVFPRLALVFRKKGEAPVVEEAIAAKLKACNRDDSRG